MGKKEPMGNATQRTYRRIRRIVPYANAPVRAKRTREPAKGIPQKPEGLWYTRKLKKVSLLRNRRQEPTDEGSPKGGGFKSNQERRQEQYRQVEALSILNIFQRWAEAQEWIKKQDRETLEFVLGLINKLDEDTSYTPTLDETDRLKSIHDAWTNEPPDWW
jgi:hypothetical protein